MDKQANQVSSVFDADLGRGAHGFVRKNLPTSPHHLSPAEGLACSLDGLVNDESTTRD